MVSRVRLVSPAWYGSLEYDSRTWSVTPPALYFKASLVSSSINSSRGIASELNSALSCFVADGDVAIFAFVPAVLVGIAGERGKLRDRAGYVDVLAILRIYRFGMGFGCCVRLWARRGRVQLRFHYIASSARFSAAARSVAAIAARSSAWSGLPMSPSTFLNGLLAKLSLCRLQNLELRSRSISDGTYQ